MKVLCLCFVHDLSSTNKAHWGRVIALHISVEADEGVSVSAILWQILSISSRYQCLIKYGIIDMFKVCMTSAYTIYKIQSRLISKKVIFPFRAGSRLFVSARSRNCCSVDTNYLDFFLFQNFGMCTKVSTNII